MIASPNFRSTHLAMQKLRTYADFTAEQAHAMIEAAETNSQVRQILLDDDVRAFFADLLDKFAATLPTALATRLRDGLQELGADGTE